MFKGNAARIVQNNLRRNVAKKLLWKSSRTVIQGIINGIAEKFVDRISKEIDKRASKGVTKKNFPRICLTEFQMPEKCCFEKWPISKEIYKKEPKEIAEGTPSSNQKIIRKKLS